MELGPILGIAGVIGLLVGVVSCSIEENKMFEAKMQNEYENCIMAKETEYTCKAYITSMRAKRSADEAGVMAAVGVGMAAGNMGSKR